MKNNKSNFIVNQFEKAVLISIYSGSYYRAVESLNELKELSITCGINFVGTILQKQRKYKFGFFIGSGKIKQIKLFATKKKASILIFDQELTPSQNRIINAKVELKVIDRTQLILDIFANRAKTKEGKIQVELAQLKYILPRLFQKNVGLSRLSGGIGGRGPGETKLEINKRRVREKIHRLEKAMKMIQKNRKLKNKKRKKQNISSISIVGYTNAGKSTLLNSLAKDNVLVENKFFATLDPTSRCIKLSKNKNIIITDTVGFISNLPKDIMTSFMATLEELNRADLLLHLIDISHPRFEIQVKSVDLILSELSLSNVKTIRVLNKKDLLNKKVVDILCRRLNAIAISSINPESFFPLLKAIDSYF